MAQAEHQQRVVSFAAVSHQFPPNKHRHQFTIDCAFESNIFQSLHPEIERRLPRAAKFLGTGLTTQIIAIPLCHVDHRGRSADAASIGQRLDKGFLSFRCPAIVAEFARDRGEIRQRRSGVTWDWRSVLHNAVLLLRSSFGQCCPSFRHYAPPNIV